MPTWHPPSIARVDPPVPPAGKRAARKLLRVPTVLAGSILSLLVAAAPAATPTASGGLHEGKPRVTATLVSDVTQVEPGGTFRLGVQFQMAPGWHISWRNPGEAGLPSEVVWDAPRVTVDGLAWPAPEIHRSPDGALSSYGYG